MKKNNDFSPEVEESLVTDEIPNPLDSGDSSEYSTEILYEDSFEDRPLDDESGQKNRLGNIMEKFLSMKRWKKVVLCVVTAIVVVVAGLTGSFFYLRAQGEKNLKTKVTVGAESEDDEEGLFVTYNGKKYQYNEDVINFLCLGIDKDIPIEERREAENLANGSAGLADAIILISVNVESGSIKIFAIPRDTIVPIQVVDAKGNFIREESGQINLQHVYGQTADQACELMVEAVSRLLYQVPIQRYCSLNLAAIPVLNDAIGGVDVQVLEDIDGDVRNYHAGETVHLEGDMARDYIQKRDINVVGSSLGRVERQKQYMNNYFAKAKEAVKNDLTLPLTVYNGLQEHMCTNITPEDIAYLVPELLGMPLTAEDITTIPGEATLPDKYLEYIVDANQLKELVISSFYKEVP